MTPSLDASATSFAAAQANILQYVIKQLPIKNAALVEDYLNHKWATWKTSVDAGKIDNSNPPRPPASFTLSFEPDELGTRWATWLQNGPPVCEMPPLPEDRSKPQAPPSSQGNDQVMNVPPDDHFPVGFRVSGPDGSVWQKMASPTPFGVALYYQKVGTDMPVQHPNVAVWGT